jgi:hypothetical protein
MTIIWENGEQIVATTDPEVYNFDNYSGMVWINVETHRSWFGGVENWTSLNMSTGLILEQQDILIPGIGSVKDAIKALQKKSKGGKGS